MFYHNEPLSRFGGAGVAGNVGGQAIDEEAIGLCTNTMKHCPATGQKPKAGSPM